MSTQETQEIQGRSRNWLLKDWQNLGELPFDLEIANFGIDWSSDRSSGSIEFRLSGRGGHTRSFDLDRGTYRGILDLDGRVFSFTFILTVTAPRVMTGRFFDLSKSGGPDPVATWGAEERGGWKDGEARS